MIDTHDYREDSVKTARLLVVEREDRAWPLISALRARGLQADDDRESEAARWYATRLRSGDRLLEIAVPTMNGPWLVHTLTHLARALSFGWELVCGDVPALIVFRRGRLLGADPDYVTLLDRLLRLQTAGAVGVPVVGAAVDN